MKTILVVILLIFIGKIGFPQEKLKISFKENHVENITNLIVDPSGEYFYTSDIFGKIIMWQTCDYSYFKTISEGAYNRPVHQMRLSADGQSLLVTEGWQGRGASRDLLTPRVSKSGFFEDLDSVSSYFPFSDKTPGRFQSSFDILGHEFDSILLVCSYSNNEASLVAFETKNSSKMLFNFQTEFPVMTAAMTTKNNIAVFAEYESLSSDLKEKYYLNILNYKDGKILYREDFEEKIIEILFDDKLPLVYLFTYDYQKSEIKLLKLYLDTYKIEEIKTYPFRGQIIPFVYTQRLRDYSVVITDSYSEPLIFIKVGTEFVKQNFTLGNDYNNISAAAFIPVKNHLIFWKDKNSYFGCNPELRVYDYEIEAELKKYSIETQNSISGAFLPNDNWYVEGFENNNDGDISSIINPQKKFFKFYKRGTFTNKLGRLNFKDYMRITHNVEIISGNEIFIDENSGKMVFIGYLDESLYAKPKYIIYNLAKDIVDTTYSVEVDAQLPICYSDSTGRILCATMTDIDGTRGFNVVQKDRNFNIEGKYAQAELSMNGEFVFLVGIDNTVRVLRIGNSKPLYEKHLGNSSDVRIGAIDKTGFWLSYTYQIPKEIRFATESILIGCEKDSITEKIFSNILISSLSCRKDKVAFIFEGLLGRTVFMSENQKLDFFGAVFPVKVSLNSDAGKMMLSFNNGTIGIYNTSDMALIGTMIHPNERSHIILKSNSFFTSNVEANEYMQYHRANSDSTFKDIFDYYNKPEEVLDVFGTPDPYYLEILKKTSKIRQSRIAVKTNDENLSKPIIKNVYREEENNSSLSLESSIDFYIEVFDESSEIIEIQIINNGVLIVKKNIDPVVTSNTNAKLLVNVPLVDGDNNLNIIAINKQGNQSDFKDYFIFYKSPTNTSELYLLTIGLSDYKQSGYKLSFADKDAYDLAMLYGDFNTIDTENYKNKFFGDRYSVTQNNKKSGLGEISYDGEDIILSNFYQVDYIGNYWIERTNREDFYLWDFGNSSREKIELPDLYFNLYDFENVKFMPSPDNDGFYFTTVKNKKFKYNFLKKDVNEILINEKTKFFPLKGEKMLKYSSNLEQISGSKTEYRIEISIFPTMDTKDVLETIEFAISAYTEPVMLATSGDAELFLFYADGNLIFSKQVDGKWEHKTIDGIKSTSSLGHYCFLEDDEFLSVLDYTGDSYNHYSYSLETGDVIATIINNSDYSKFGINNINGNVQWISTSSSIAENASRSFEDEIVLKTDLQPFSFSNVNIQVLTNEGACKEMIFQNFESFFKNVKTNDEVIVFLAGHGLLDKSLNYYFAPYDMDFSQPETFGISYNDLIELIKKIPCTRKLLILDSCHAGDIFDSENIELSDSNIEENDGRGGNMIVAKSTHVEKVSEIMAILFENISYDSGITVITASSGTDVAYENRNLSNGALTASLIEGIINEFKGDWGIVEKDNIKTVLLTDRFIYKLQLNVIETTKGKQIPNVREINKNTQILIW